jgi:hypothetical protein
VSVCGRVRACARARGHVRAWMQPCLSSMQLVCAILWSHLWSLSLHNIFRHYLINGTILGKKNLLNIKFVFWFSLQLLFKAFLILKRIQSDIVIKVKSLQKFPLFLSDFNETGIFSTRFRKTIKYQIPSKSVQWEPSSYMRMDRRTWRS